MTPRIQKFALLTHIACSVGWFGAIVPYLALVFAGLATKDVQMARAACLSMELIGWYIIVPFSVAALLSGLFQSLFTQWGLLRHWWILAKAALTIFAVLVLLRHMQDVSHMAKETSLSSADFRPDFVHAAGGLLILFAAMTLSVFKPWGMTSYGKRQASQNHPASFSSSHAAPVRVPVLAAGKSQWPRIIKIHAVHAVAIILLFGAILHIAVMQHHGH